MGSVKHYCSIKICHRGRCSLLKLYYCISYFIVCYLVISLCVIGRFYVKCCIEVKFWCSNFSKWHYSSFHLSCWRNIKKTVNKFNISAYLKRADAVINTDKHAGPVEDAVEEGNEGNEGHQVCCDVGHQRNGRDHAFYGRVQDIRLSASLNLNLNYIFVSQFHKMLFINWYNQ